MLYFACSPVSLGGRRAYLPVRMRCFRVLAGALALVGGALHTAQAQTAADCGPPLLPQLCVDFDAQRSIDATAGDLVYRWRMGDSTTLTGFAISYCYKRRARYQVVLDVLVPATGEVRLAEKTFEVDLITQPVNNLACPLPLSTWAKRWPSMR